MITVFQFFIRERWAAWYGVATAQAAMEAHSKGTLSTIRNAPRPGMVTYSANVPCRWSPRCPRCRHRWSFPRRHGLQFPQEST